MKFLIFFGICATFICASVGEIPSDSQCQNVITRGLSKEEIKKIINMHNKLRQKVANGLETRGKSGSQPKAKSLPDVKWDDELAAMAQKWANRCPLDHDKNRKVERFFVGQNIGMTGTTDEPETLNVEDIVLDWYNEVEHQPPCSANKFSGSSVSTVGHYTQLVWANSTLIGCGGIKSEEDGFNNLYLVCNYGPAGNIIGRPVYEVADKAMKC